jgi:hypothetical protein
MSTTLEPTTIAETLSRALELTVRALVTVPAEADLLELLEQRGALLDEAERARLAGVAWGDAEAELARRIVAADGELLAAVARTNGDALAWLATRDEKALDSLPTLAELCHPRELLDAAVVPPPAAFANAAARYSKTVLTLL